MGMMTPEQMPQEMPEQMPQQAPAGMMSGMQQQQPHVADPALSHGQFNGTVMVDGNPVEVKGGVANVDGKPFMVSDDGQLVVDHQGRLVGHVEGDTFVPVDAAYLKLMQDKGYVR